MRRLRIAQIAPLAYSIPPKKYGGTERVIHALTEELVARGHDVTLFATKDSKTSANLVSVYPLGLKDANIKDLKQWTLLNLLNIGNAYKLQNEFDLIHDHMSTISIPTANLSTVPVVMTLHGQIDNTNKKLFENLDKPYLVSISKSQVKNFPEVAAVDTVYNGLSLDHYPFSAEHKGYLLFVGRFFVDKGAHFAIQVARELNMPLIIAAKLEDKEEKYFNDYIYPNLDAKIRWVGEVGEKERNKLMSEAAAMLHPATWDEPFGLNMIEAMACGCPVIAFNKGSIPEVIKDGKSGYVVNSVSEMINAVKNIEKIDRAFCREYAIKNFSVKRMTDGYESLYYNILYSLKEKVPPVFIQESLLS